MATETATQNGSGNGRVQFDEDGIENPLYRLTDEQIEAIGKEFDELHDQVKADLGERDSLYIRGIIDLQRRMALLGRVLMIPSRSIPFAIAGTSVLGMAKILENMEIGHNVLHGQWDWMNDPVINSQAWDWDTASTAESWRHSHNYIHHTYTNIRGLDKDLGYEIMRIDPHQPWHPVYLLQPIYNVLLMFLFEWGVALHDLDLEAVWAGEKSHADLWKEIMGITGKMRLQVTKDYIAWPVVSALVSGAVVYGVKRSGIEDKVATKVLGKRKRARRTLGSARRRAARRTSSDGLSETIERALEIGRRSNRAQRGLGALRRRTRRRTTNEDLAAAIDVAKEAYKHAALGNVTANIIRNVWAYAIIFCGHFPDQTYTFSQEETEDESRGQKYVRQLIGAANIDGGPLFHVISGNLGYQVEHHLYPDMPSTRYGEIAPKVREICQRYELPYNTGPLSKQLGMVQRSILRLAFPGGKPRPKPGPYKGEIYRGSGEEGMAKAASAQRNTESSEDD